MDHFKTYTDFLFEFQKQDISLLESMDDYFTIGFEIEMDTDHRRIGSLPRPPKEITESKEITYSIQDRKKLMDIKSNFPIFFKKYFNVIKFHQDETVSRGIEIVTNPFNSIEDSKQFIKLFFDEFEKQDKWFFTDKTSIHINIGVKNKKKWNLVKGVLMLSDDFTFKNMESRRTSGYCNSLKDQIIFQLKGKITETNDIKEMENIINNVIEKTFKFTVKTFNMNLWKLLNRGYVEFRQVGGLLNETIVIDKMMYFIYCVYLMTSKYKQDEYYRKLFGFIQKIG